MIISRAPLRANDIGGWTDTWFAEGGKVLNLAVAPPVEVGVKITHLREKKAERILFKVRDYGKTFRMNPDKPGKDPHPLLQAAAGMTAVPEDKELTVSISSPAPPGSSLGTSASVCVALLGALSRSADLEVSAPQVWKWAHKVETIQLGLQSGIQDQISASYGGVCFIDVFRYPEARVHRLKPSENFLRELNRRLLVVYLGKAHRSSDIHERVIRTLERGGKKNKSLDRLKDAAEEARHHIEKENLSGYGRCMIRNHECQRELHPKLISHEAEKVAAAARRYGALGWKVNGAGGEGGSMTVLNGGNSQNRGNLAHEINNLGNGIRVIPACISRTGLTVEVN